MLKRKYTIAAMLTGISVMTAGLPVAAATPVSADYLKSNGVYVMIGKLPGCNIPGFPNIDIPNKPNPDRPENPETPERPEIPTPEQPGESKPGIDKPGTDKPDAGDKPGTDKPDNKPGEPDLDNGAENTSYAMQVIDLVNKERAKEGLPALQYDANIAKAALVRAKETEVSFSHTRPNGSSFSTALKEAGVSYRGAGENIAWGQKSPEEVMKGWMNSPGHRANIMNKNFTKIGVGYYQNSKGVNYWTQLFTY